jgi:hypothetical protein
MKHLSQSIRPLLICILIVLIIVCCLTFSWLQPSHHRSTNSYSYPSLTVLQANLSKSENDLNNQSIIATTTQLIDGEKEGHYKISKPTLATYYLEKGASQINLKQYHLAMLDFQMAQKLDSKLQVAALQGEVQAGYDSGEHQQLIPLLQQLVSLTKNNTDSLSDTPGQYQYDIQAIEHNQGIVL